MKYAWIAFLILSSCALSTKQRSPASYNENEWQDYLNQKQNHWRQEAANQLGLSHRLQLNQKEQTALYWRTELLKKEAELNAPSMKEQYYNNYPYFVNDRQRLAFLNIDGLFAKQDWLNRYLKKEKPADVKEAIANKDLIPNMSREAVKESWGQADEIEVSGNPVYGNERWKYTFYLDTADGEVTEERYLYFERGQLVTWQTKQK